MNVPRCHYGCDPELELIELGARVAYAYDDAHTIAYRIGEALGIARTDVPIGWQWVFQQVGRSYQRHWRHSER